MTRTPPSGTLHPVGRLHQTGTPRRSGTLRQTKTTSPNRGDCIGRMRFVNAPGRANIVYLRRNLGTPAFNGCVPCARTLTT
jgi:hypothetical protein